MRAPSRRDLCLQDTERSPRRRLPVDTTKLELAINMKTAKELGRVSEYILVRAATME